MIVKYECAFNTATYTLPTSMPLTIIAAGWLMLDNTIVYVNQGVLTHLPFGCLYNN